MRAARYRVLPVAGHPVQYAAPEFRLMAQHPTLDVQVAYCRLHGATPSMDHGFGIEVAWDVPLLGGYPSDRERLGQLGEMARQRMEMWSPRQNLDAFVTAVERAVVLRRETA